MPVVQLEAVRGAEGRVNRGAKGRQGFTIVELLVATALVLILTGGLLALVSPGAAGSKARAAAIDIQQRLRAAAEAVGADLAAGRNGAGERRLRPARSVAWSPTVLPLRDRAARRPRRDGPDRRVDRARCARRARRGTTGRRLDAGRRAGESRAGARMPGRRSGVRASRPDAVVLMLDGRGQADLFRVDVGRRARRCRSFPRGRTSGPPVSRRLGRRSGHRVHVLPQAGGGGRGRPAGVGRRRRSGHAAGGPRDAPCRSSCLASRGRPSWSPVPGLPRASYGPSPPPPPDDDPRDTWGAGENCTFVAAASGPGEPAAAAGRRHGLVPLSAAVLTDGPWCPDASAPGRYDADLLRVRAVRVTIRVEAAASRFVAPIRALRAPGTSRDRSPAADREIVFDVVPRALQRGR